MYQVGARRAVPLLINPGRGGDVLEQVVGDAPGRRQLVGEVGGSRWLMKRRCSTGEAGQNPRSW